jgi:hypothetical protein
MNSRSCLVLLSTLCAALVSNAQLPIPQKPPGFAYGKGKASAGVQLETYIDLVSSSFFVCLYLYALTSSIIAMP